MRGGHALASGQQRGGSLQEAGSQSADLPPLAAEYGGAKEETVKRLKELEKENGRLKKLVAELSLDKAILKEVAEEKW